MAIIPVAAFNNDLYMVGQITAGFQKMALTVPLIYSGKTGRKDSCPEISGQRQNQCSDEAG